MAIRGFDETYEEFEIREKFETYFGTYSAGIRKNLLSKKLEKPTDLYDVFYVKVRNDLLAKNTSTISSSIDSNSEIIRNSMLSINENKSNANIENEDVRKNLLSKNKLIKTSIGLDDIADGVRKKITNNEQENISLEKGSEGIRNAMLGKNTPKTTNLEESSISIRNSMLSNDIESSINLEQTSAKLREDVLSKNIDNSKNLEVHSETYRVENLSKIVIKETNLEDSSKTTRNTQLKNNTEINNNDINKKLSDEQKKKIIKESNINLEGVSKNFRDDNLKKNDTNGVDLEKQNETYLSDNLNKNIPIKSDLEKKSITFRNNNLSNNDEITKDIEKTSDAYRNDLVSTNKDNSKDLENISSEFRANNLSNNNSESRSLEILNEPIRNDLISSNKENNKDIEKESNAYRSNNLSNNTPKATNLEKEGEIHRDSNLSNNVSSDLNIDKTSESQRKELLSSNVSNPTNLEEIGYEPRENILSKNVPNNTNLEELSGDERKEQLSKNIITGINLEKTGEDERKDQLAKNITTGSNLEKIAEAERREQLSKNISKNINVEEASEEIRKTLLSTTVPEYSDLEKQSKAERNQQLAKKANSKEQELENNSVLSRNNLLSKNVPKTSNLLYDSSPFRHDLLASNTSKVLGANITMFGTSQFIGLSNLWAYGVAIRGITKLKDQTLAYFFGTDLQKYYSTKLQSNGYIPEAQITNNIQLHNIEQNVFALKRYDYGANLGQSKLLEHTSEGFQELLTFSSDKGFGMNNGKQSETNTTPFEIISKNKGKYLSSEPEDLLRAGDVKVGSTISKMAQTEPSDILVDEDFIQRRRGVAHIIDDIKKGDYTISKNYEVQGEIGVAKSFVIGLNKKDKSPKKSMSRFTIRNPYAPEGAGALTLMFKNYSNNQTMSFPPYINSFQHSDNANWNSTQFLGRPEPLYTFANGTREGSITFVVLTDYSQEVDMGYEFNTENTTVTKIKEDFTDLNFVNKTFDIKDGLEAKLKQQKDELSDLVLERTLKNINDVSGLAELSKKIREKSEEVSKTENAIGKVDSITSVLDREYSETNRVGTNIYNPIMQGYALDKKDGDIFAGLIDSKPGNTINILNDMKKDMLFQPSYFSGSKVDFVSRMEFLSKMTKPSRNNDSFGFSFIKPPICHIWLGDWLNYDIVINSISYDYNDSPWTIDGGRVQPMWVQASINFNIIGKWGNEGGGDVPLSTDEGGFYSKIIK